MKNIKNLFHREVFSKTADGFSAEEHLLEKTLLVALVYFLTARISLIFAFAGTNTSAVWPPSAIGFAAVLFWGVRIWPGIAVGAFLANVVVFISNAAPVSLGTIVLASSLIAVGNTLEACVGFYLVKRWIGRINPVERIQNVFKFFGIAFLMCLASAAIGPLSICLLKIVPWKLFPAIWLTWWIGDVMGIFTVMPVLLASYKSFFKPLVKRGILESLGFIAILLIVNSALFGGFTHLSRFHWPATFFIFPLMVWATFRFNLTGMALTILTTFGFSVLGTAKGFGPFGGMPPEQSLLFLQIFLGINSLMGLLLAAALKERDQAEKVMLNNELRFRYLIEKSMDLIALLNSEGKIIYATPSTRAILGYTLDQYVGRNIFEFIHPDEMSARMNDFQQVLECPRLPVTAQYRFRHCNGSWLWFEGTEVNLLDEPSVGAIVINYRNITERKQAEDLLRRDKETLAETIMVKSQELFKTQQQLKHANRLADIGTLAATVAHELRNPLGVIQLATYNIKKKYPMENKHLLNIEKKVMEGNQIINNLLNYSRIQQPCFEKFLVLGALKECVAFTKNQFQNKNIQFEENFLIPYDTLLEADVLQIKEIFSNILTNACQAIDKPKGRITIILQLQDGGVLQFSVEDNGNGIDPADLDKIFDPFFTRKSKGTGLGLAICNELVHLHDGQIKITSQKDIGTTVVISLSLTRG